MSELKKCPFCGEEAYVEQIPENTEEEKKQHPNWNWNFPGMWVVGCRTPSCLGRIESFNSIFVSRGSAVEKWNKRPTGKWVHLGGGEYSCDLELAYKAWNRRPEDESGTAENIQGGS